MPRKTISTSCILSCLTVLGAPAAAVAGTDDCPECGTIVPAGNVIAETWTAAGSPYCVTGDIGVSLLTIEPGVCVLVDGPYKIEVLTTIAAVGTASEPIVFGPRDPGVPWKGLRFQNTPPGSELGHCEITGSDSSGIQIIQSFPDIHDCRIVGNSTTVTGGGLFIDITTGDFTLSNVEVCNNTANSHGGGIAAQLDDGTLHLVDGCEIRGNTANAPINFGTYHGGGLWIIGDLVMDGALIQGNLVNANAQNHATQTARGGGIYCAGGADIRNSRVVANSAVAYDGGSFNTWVTYGGGIFANAPGPISCVNCVIACNTLSNAVTHQGAGLAIGPNVAMTLENCTVARNDEQGILHSGAESTIRNSILYWNNQTAFDPNPEMYGPQIIGAALSPVSYSCVQGGHAGEGNIDFGPFLVNDVCGGSGGDYRIGLGSPCTDAGNPDGAYDDACMPPSLGTVRNDMGAYGGPGACDWPEEPCTADINADGLVGFVDLNVILNGWGACPSCACDTCKGDFDKDGQLGFTDLNALLATWGPC